MTVKLLSSLSLLALMAGCGGGGKTANSVTQVPPPVKPDKQQVVGYWSAQTASNVSYEFFSSATEPPYNAPINTGRILQGGKAVSPFYWDLQLDGTILVNAVDPGCMQRPLNLCAVVSSQSIVASGSSVQDASWTVSFDDNADGVTDRKVTDTYHRADINLADLAQGEFFLTHSANRIFDDPIPGTVAGSTMSIRLDDFEKPITVSAPAFGTAGKSVQFSADENSSVLVDKEFFVTGSGYMTFPVKKWYSNVSLTSSANGEYALSYELNSKVQVPAGTDAKAVQLGSTETVEKKSIVSGVLNKFVGGIPVHALDNFYISMELDFKKANAGNEMHFTSATEGSVSHTLPHHPEAVSEVRPFNWTQGADGAVHFKFPNFGDVNLRFIQPINDGYQVLYSVPDDDYGTVYRVRDLVQDAPPALNEQNIVGRYKFTSISPLPNGSHEYDLTFHKDKTVTGTVGGYWFQDVNGDIVSFECTLLNGQKISVYAQCAAALDDLSTVSFAHVRRVKFMHQDGNNFQAKYDGSVYGGQFTAQGKPFSTFSLTYRWVRVGDEPKADD